jgi:hypothetical protein
MIVAWSDLEIPGADFDIAALHAALDLRRTKRGITWEIVAREGNRADERRASIRSARLRSAV